MEEQIKEINKAIDCANDLYSLVDEIALVFSNRFDKYGNRLDLFTLEYLTVVEDNLYKAIHNMNKAISVNEGR